MRIKWPNSEKYIALGAVILRYSAIYIIQFNATNNEQPADAYQAQIASTSRNWARRKGGI